MAITPVNISVAASRPHFERNPIIFVFLPKSTPRAG